MSSIRLCAPSRFRVVGAVSPTICRTAAFTAFRFSDAVAIWDRSSPVCRESCSIAAGSARIFSTVLLLTFPVSASLSSAFVSAFPACGVPAASASGLCAFVVSMDVSGKIPACRLSAASCGFVCAPCLPSFVITSL